MRKVLLAVLTGLALAVIGSVTWTKVASSGRLHPFDEAPAAPVAMVFGGQLDGERPMPVLRLRLETTVRLYLSGKVKAVLVTGDANGGSGNETAVMTRYLVRAGVPQSVIRVDGWGLDTHASCRRAADLFGVGQALLVTQRFHLPRAVALCRAAGIDAHGVDAGCAGCDPVRYVWNTVRDWLAAPKAVFEVLSDLWGSFAPWPKWF